MPHHPSAAKSPTNSWWRRANSGAADGLHCSPILRSSKDPSFRGIVTDKDSPSRQRQWDIFVHISELHPRWRKMRRKMRPLSAAPHQARCGQMGAGFPDYIIERRLVRANRPSGREVQLKRAPETRPSPVRRTISIRMVMARQMRFPGYSPRLELRHLRGRKPVRLAGHVPGNFPRNAFRWECISRRFPGIPHWAFRRTYVPRKFPGM